MENHTIKKANISIDPMGTPTSPKGFKASGVIAGLKRSGRPDMALLVSDLPMSAAGIFTRCLFAAAPVQISRNRILSEKPMRAVITNSGNANACTGEEGMRNAEAMCEKVATLLDLSAEEVLVCSTGRIGKPMPMDMINHGIDLCVNALSLKGGQQMVEAIMTTDTREKQGSVSFCLPSSNKEVTIGGTCKGAGMIAPEMISPKSTRLHATMLAYLTTDVEATPIQLQKALEKGASYSFNNITVDGDMSTNDTCFLLANGASGAKLETQADKNMFQAALNTLMFNLAKAIVMDAEGATKCVSVTIVHARSIEDAKKAVRAICNSLLCKTAWFGGDPNWGRITAALGYSGAMFDPSVVDIYYDGVPVVQDGCAASTPESELAAIMKNPSFSIKIDLNDGRETTWMMTSDISYEYVKINAEYYT